MSKKSDSEPVLGDWSKSQSEEITETYSELDENTTHGVTPPSDDLEILVGETEDESLVVMRIHFGTSVLDIQMDTKCAITLRDSLNRKIQDRINRQ